LTMTSLWRPAYVAIGSNLQSPRARVLESIERLKGLDATRLLLRSRLYLTDPMGPQNQPQFVNAAAGLLTQLPPRELLEGMLGIERAMGRDRAQRWGPRVIDLDLLWLVDAPVEEPGLTLPHPGVSSRNFVLYPLADIAPTITIPGFGRVLDMLRAVGDAGISVLEESQEL
jgi:2-amino-4-hydroxy-6-hydroxymethyldihydropteridine diphosphokinase